MRSKPLMGEYKSKINMIAADTHNAATKKVATAVAFRGENSPQLTKMPVRQKISTNSNGFNTVVERCSIVNQRIFDTLFRRPSASDFIIRCASFVGVRLSSWS